MSHNEQYSAYAMFAAASRLIAIIGNLALEHTRLNVFIILVFVLCFAVSDSPPERHPDGENHTS